MHQFKNILLVAEEHGSIAESLAQTRALADRNDAKLTVIDVVDKMPHGTYEDLQVMWSELREEQIHRTLVDSGQATEPIVIAVGVDFVEIVRAVIRFEYDLVVIPDTDERYSSTTLHILRKCPVPVWVMRPGRTVPQRILVAVDPSPDDSIRQSLNELVLDLATSIARRTNGELTIVHTWTVPGESTYRTAMVLRHSDFELRVERARRDIEARAKRDLESLLGGYDLKSLAHQVRFVHGVAGHVVPEIAAERDVDLIVMGTVARIDTPGLFIGRNAEMIIQKVDCPILAVKPEQFETPIRVPSSQ